MEQGMLLTLPPNMSAPPHTTPATAGVKLILTPATSAMFNRAGMLTADGRCKMLDAAADGYVRGEAFVSIVLQSSPAGATSSALCLLAGSAVNQDGRSSTLTAPNGPAQQAAVRQALASGGWAAVAVGMVQLHGTGTPLGDPIEVGALAAVLAASRAGSTVGQPVVLAAGKTSMGHTEPAAGLVGAAHAAAALGSSLVQPILHLHKVSESEGSSRSWKQCTRHACTVPAPADTPAASLFPNPGHLPTLYAAEPLHGGQRERRQPWPVCHAPPAGRPHQQHRQCDWHQFVCLPGHQRPCAGRTCGQRCCCACCGTHHACLAAAVHQCAAARPHPAALSQRGWHRCRPAHHAGHAARGAGLPQLLLRSPSVRQAHLPW